MQTAEFNFEVKRKMFHLYSLIFPLTYLFLTKFQALACLSLIVIFTIYLDISRNYNQKIKDLIDKFFKKFMRENEKSGLLRLSSASYMAMGLFLSALFFPKGLAITSWFILAISDSVAALVGMKIGTKTVNGKSLAGCLAFFVSAFFISIISYMFIGYDTSFVIIVLACKITTIVEYYSSQMKIDDNLSIPLSYCIVTVVLIFLSGL